MKNVAVAVGLCLFASSVVALPPNVPLRLKVYEQKKREMKDDNNLYQSKAYRTQSGSALTYYSIELSAAKAIPEVLVKWAVLVETKDAENLSIIEGENVVSLKIGIKTTLETDMIETASLSSSSTRGYYGARNKTSRTEGDNILGYAVEVFIDGELVASDIQPPTIKNKIEKLRAIGETAKQNRRPAPQPVKPVPDPTPVPPPAPKKPTPPPLPVIPPSPPKPKTPEELQHAAELKEYDSFREAKVLFDGKPVEKSALIVVVGFVREPQPDLGANAASLSGTWLEVAKRRGAAPAENSLVDLRPGLWEVTDEFVLLKDYEANVPVGLIVRVYCREAPRADGHRVFRVGKEPTFDEWKALRATASNR